MSAPGGIPKTWVILLNGGMTKVGDAADAVGGKNHSPVSRRLAGPARRRQSISVCLSRCLTAQEWQASGRKPP